jgi:tRNA nucleotidyltransferase (CCA-adding enzyme)
MVRSESMPSRGAPIENLAEALRDAYPELAVVADAAGDRAVYLVGGAVRDLLSGRERGDIDVVVVGDPADLAADLGAETLAQHERFGTIKVGLDGHEVDLATARTETYAHPGALPTVAPADSIEADLARRDFTVNAMALPLADPGALVDPHGGSADLDAGLLRVLHPASFADDPTRAIRAARYAARFGFGLERGTEELLRATDLDTVSAERYDAELLRLAAEDTAPRGFELLGEWGLVELRSGGAELAAAVSQLMRTDPWQGEGSRAGAILAAALGPVSGEDELVAASPASPSEGVELARRRGTVELVLARALGASWLDEYVGAWRSVTLEIDGDDLITAGVSAGPAVGRGLEAALRAKLDGETGGRDEELAVALRAARAG